MDDTEAAIRKSVVTQSLIDAMNERLVEYGFDNFTKWDFIVHHCAIEADHLIAEAVAAAEDRLREISRLAEEGFARDVADFIADRDRAVAAAVDAERARQAVKDRGVFRLLDEIDDLIAVGLLNSRSMVADAALDLRNDYPDIAALRVAASTTPTDPEPCASCGGTHWVEDENWSPEYPELYARFGQERIPHDGLIPCGACSLGEWDHPWPAATPTDAATAFSNYCTRAPSHTGPCNGLPNMGCPGYTP